MSTLHICWTDPMIELARRDAGIRWCYGCRKRLPHTDVLMGYPPPPDPAVDPAGFDAFLDSQAAYYEPSWERRCSGCGHDRTTMW